MKSDPYFSALSEGFAAFILRLEGRDCPELALAAKLICEAVNRGHVCLDLNAVVQGDFLEGTDLPDELLTLWPLTEWCTALRNTTVVGAPGTFHPLILDDANRLYLHRYWVYENALAQGLLDRSQVFKTLGLANLTAKLDLYFPAEAEAGINWQRTAALLAATRSFCVISGGPGTGKTTTVVKILALLLEMAGEHPLAIALAAPTGKAAARLKSAITKAKGELPCSAELLASIPEDVRTLHRLLGSIHHSPSFRHNATTPLPYDVVVVDEASMVDLPMMAKLILALPAHARLILLGDKHQLASVEAGAVLGDICQTGAEISYSIQMQDTLGELLGLPETAFGNAVQTGPGDSLVTLQKNYRFNATSGIGLLSTAVNAGCAQESASLLANTAFTDVIWVECPPESHLREALSERILTGFAPYLAATSAAEALAKFNHFLVLCALRNGPFGVSTITLLAEQLLANRGLILPASRWYKGRPIMITANDYNLGLFNGDTGIIWPDDTQEQRLRAYFPDPNGHLRSLAPSRLPNHETVFASTVHKSQGSEFDNILLLLPPHDTRALSRELIYTGITRAKHSVEIWGRPEVFSLALQRRVQRTSGLRDAIWSAGLAE
jgi:exodeoxyribonuclease V alpha subunit